MTAALGINWAGCRVFEGSNFEGNEKPKQPRPISFASSGTDSTNEVALVKLADETITHEATPMAIKPTHHTHRADTTKATCSECSFPRNR